MPSLSPYVNSFSENEILTFPTCVFDHRSDLNEHHELQIFDFYNEHSEQARAPYTNDTQTDRGTCPDVGL
jgi:hypothetical protein